MLLCQKLLKFSQFIGIPVGIFQGIFYQKDRPRYINYGILGTIIAHEVYHVVNEGEHRNLQGELRSWRSPNSLLNYEKKLQCLSNHYNKLRGPGIERRVSWIIIRISKLDIIALCKHGSVKF